MKMDELTALVADDAGITKEAADKARKSLFDHIGAALLAGESVQLKGFGTFRASGVRRTDLRNPRTGALLAARGVVRVTFHAGATLRRRLQPLADRAQSPNLPIGRNDDAPAPKRGLLSRVFG